jgi:hypothetical protein
VILVVLFDKRATLGMIRIKVPARPRAERSIFRLFARSVSVPATPSAAARSPEAEDEIDRIFGGL